MSNSSNIYVSDKNITGVGLLADEEENFKIRSSVLLLILKIIGLVILTIIIVWLFLHFQVVEKIGLKEYKMWVNLVPVIAIGIAALSVFINWLATIFILTTKRVQISHRFITAYDKSIALNRVHSIKYLRTIFGAIFGYVVLSLNLRLLNLNLDLLIFLIPKNTLT